MNNSKLRWGILGTAEIARKNWKAIQLTGNSCVAAVASRDLERSRKFITECQAEAPMELAATPFGSYQEMLDSSEIDAVYIPLPTGLRREWVLRAAESGKHVVCEKPCACTVSELREMLDACKRKNVQFMDGVMFVHSGRFQHLRQLLDASDNIGQIKRITSAFSFYGTPEFYASNIRAQSELEPLGCLGDLGWYCIRLALWVMNMEMPVQVSGRLLSERSGAGSPSAVPTEFSGELQFASGVSSGFYCSFETTIEQWAIITGTHGSLEMSDFVLPFAGKELSMTLRKSDYEIDGCDFRMQTEQRAIVVPEWSHGRANSQETNCYRAFAEKALSGSLDNALSEAALKTQIVMEACLASARKEGRTIPL